MRPELACQMSPWTGGDRVDRPREGRETGCEDQPPVTANQAPRGLATKTIGAMQGWGRVRSASISALPPPAVAGPVVAGTGWVRTFWIEASAPRQLTIARNAATGFEPGDYDGWTRPGFVLPGGTGPWAGRGDRILVPTTFDGPP